MWKYYSTVLTLLNCYYWLFHTKPTKPLLNLQICEIKKSLESVTYFFLILCGAYVEIYSSMCFQTCSREQKHCTSSFWSTNVAENLPSQVLSLKAVIISSDDWFHPICWWHLVHWNSKASEINLHPLPAMLSAWKTNGSVCIVDSVCGGGATKSHVSHEFLLFLWDMAGHMMTFGGTDVARHCAALTRWHQQSPFVSADHVQCLSCIIQLHRMTTTLYTYVYIK